jgi:hypothetical protein
MKKAKHEKHFAVPDDYFATLQSRLEQLPAKAEKPGKIRRLSLYLGLAAAASLILGLWLSGPRWEPQSTGEPLDLTEEAILSYLQSDPEALYFNAALHGELLAAGALPADSGLSEADIIDFLSEQPFENYAL